MNESRLKDIDKHDCEFSYVNHLDYPDYSDAYIERATWKSTGKELTESELDQLHEEHNDWVYETIFFSLHWKKRKNHNYMFLKT